MADRSIYVTWSLMLVIITLSAVSVTFLINENFFKKPYLEVEPYPENSDLCFRIHNSGNKRALIESVTVCCFDNPNSSICNRTPKKNLTIGVPQTISASCWVYNPEFEILSEDTQIINTGMSTSALEDFICPSDGRGGVEICEATLGCKVYEEYGIPQVTKGRGGVQYNHFGMYIGTEHK